MRKTLHILVVVTMVLVATLVVALAPNKPMVPVIRYAALLHRGDTYNNKLGQGDIPVEQDFLLVPLTDAASVSTSNNKKGFQSVVFMSKTEALELGKKTQVLLQGITADYGGGELVNLVKGRVTVKDIKLAPGSIITGKNLSPQVVIVLPTSTRVVVSTTNLTTGAKGTHIKIRRPRANADDETRVDNYAGNCDLYTTSKTTPEKNIKPGRGAKRSASNPLYEEPAEEETID